MDTIVHCEWIRSTNGLNRVPLYPEAGYTKRCQNGPTGGLQHESTDMHELLCRCLNDGVPEINIFLSSLDEREKQVLDKMISTSIKYGWLDFSGLVYATKPMVTVPRGCVMDLRAIANDYRPIRI